MTDDPRMGSPPVEPLSEAAWSRVERGIWSQLDAERAPAPQGARRWWLVAAPLAAAAAVAALVLVTRGSPGFDEPVRMVAGPTPVSALFADSHIELQPFSALVMGHEAAHPTVLVERGAAWFTVAPRKSRPAFIVRAGDTVVRVVGTRFQVARSEERIAVEVAHGQVDVNFRGTIVSVGAGKHWSSDEPGKVLAVAAAPPSVDPVVAAAPSATAVPATPASPAPTTTPPRPRHPPPAASSADVRPQPQPTTPPDELDVDRDRAEYDRLAELEARSPETALAGYMALAKGTSRWADPALFAAARLAVDRHDRRAETLVGMYLLRFPGGANATDARRLLALLRNEKPE